MPGTGTVRHPGRQARPQGCLRRSTLAGASLSECVAVGPLLCQPRGRLGQAGSGVCCARPPHRARPSAVPVLASSLFPPAAPAMADAVSAPPAAEAGDQKQAAAAATLIQHAWRKHASQRADQLWDEMVQSLVQKQVQEQSRSHHPDQPSAPNKRWQRGAFYAQQLAGKPQAGDAAPFSWQGTSSYEKPDTAVSGGPSLVPRTDDNDSLPAAQEKSLRLVERWAARSKPEFGGHDGKVMDQAYWLELVDKHHRYGSNLKQYHTEWDKAQTQQNFFYWLDRGEGRAVDLPACPRSRLDSEHVTYLTASQRCNYIVDVDSQGRLRYRRNGELADTSPYRWTDLGEGRGIGPLSEKEAQDARAAAAARRSSSESSSASGSEWSRYSSDGDSDAEEEAAAHYSNARTNNTRNPLQKLSTGGWTNKLLRKTIASNTW